jgi:hypothetical protein
MSETGDGGGILSDEMLNTLELNCVEGDTDVSSVLQRSTTRDVSSGLRFR